MEPDPELSPWYAKLDADPGHQVAVMRLTRGLIARDRPAELIALSQRLAAAHPTLADLVLRMSTKQLPQHFELAEAFCLLPESQGNAIVANTRWSLIRRRNPRLPEAHLGYIRAMLRQGRGQEAALAAEAAMQFLGVMQLPLREAQAEVAEARQRYEDAARYWAGIARDFPGHAEAAAREAACAQKAVEHPAPAETAVVVPPIPPDADPEALKKLVTGFESLGHNCEFGLMQRHFGAEPLGLLRFSFTLVPTLKALLGSRFEGIGDPACMSITHGGHEYLVHHGLTTWVMHTRIKPSPETDLDKLLRDQARHAAFLKAKLIKDLQNPSKVFVYWRTDLTDADIDAIDAALRSYGNGVLMCVRLCDDAHPAGSFEWRHERLMVAALDRPGNAFRGAAWNISFDYWIHFCRIAQARWDEVRQQAVAA